MRRLLNVSAAALTLRHPVFSVSGLFHAHRMLHCRRNKISLCHVQQGSVSQPKHVQPPTTTQDPEEEDEDFTLPSHMIVKHTPHKPPSMSLEEYESRQRQTELFLNTVLEVRHTQDAIDMVCAALRLGTWKPHHAAALLRKAKRRYSDLAAATSSTGENDDETASTIRRAPREPSVTPSSVVERLVLVVTALLEHRNRAGAWSDVISQKTLDDLFLWIAAPFVEKAKQLQQADNLVEDETEGDEAGGAAVVGGGEEGGEQVVVDSEDLHHQEQPVLSALSSSSSLISPSSLPARPMVYQETYGAHSTTSMLWSWCSMLELHGIGIGTVLGLDALSIALRDDEALHYQSLRQATRGAAGMSTPQRDEVRQNRLEYLDNQRAKLRDAELKEELQRNSALRRGGGPAPRQALKSQS
jgi:hypothetical protein